MLDLNVSLWPQVRVWLDSKMIEEEARRTITSKNHFLDLQKPSFLRSLAAESKLREIPF